MRTIDFFVVGNFVIFIYVLIWPVKSTHILRIRSNWFHDTLIGLSEGAALPTHLLHHAAKEMKNQCFPFVMLYVMSPLPVRGRNRQRVKGVIWTSVLGIWDPRTRPPAIHLLLVFVAPINSACTPLCTLAPLGTCLVQFAVRIIRLCYIHQEL